MNYDEINKFFKFYKYNEEVFLDSEKYLFIDIANKDSYSFCFSNLLINICSDFEALCKKYLNINENTNITQIINSLKSDNNFTNFFTEKITLVGTTYKNIEPLKNDGFTFQWWSRYNDIKHDKLNSIIVATQENVINALAALYTLNMYILNAIAKREKKPDIFLDYRPIFSLTNLINQTISLNNCFFAGE